MKISPNYADKKEDEVREASITKEKAHVVVVNLDICEINSLLRQVVAENSSINGEEISVKVGVDVEARNRIGKDEGKNKPVGEGASEEVNTLNGVNKLSKEIVVGELTDVKTGHGWECKNESEIKINLDWPRDKMYIVQL